MTSAAKRAATSVPVVRHAVYRTYDEHGNPVYYGRSVNPFARLATHSNSDNGREWIDLVCRVEIDWHATLQEAVDAERELTLRDEPAFAKQGLLVAWPKSPHPYGQRPLPRPPTRAEREAPPIDYAVLILRTMARLDKAERPASEELSGSIPLSRMMILRKATSMIPKPQRVGANAKLRQALDILATTPRSRVIEDVYPLETWHPHARTYRYLSVMTESIDPNL